MKAEAFSERENRGKENLQLPLVTHWGHLMSQYDPINASPPLQMRAAAAGLGDDVKSAVPVFDFDVV